MKTLLIGINAKYIHTNLAIRLLKANTSFPVDIYEMTTKDPDEKLINVIKTTYNVIGISCYIWNIEYVKNLLLKLRIEKPNLVIILGGPEVSFNAQEYINNYQVDFVIRQEGEKAFDLLLQHIYNGLPLEEIPNLSYKNHDNPCQEIVLDTLNSGQFLANDFPNRIAYIESSRGCPYHCGYCMASINNHLRFFDLEKVKSELAFLIHNNTKTVKFLDRTFNADIKKAKEIFSYIIKNHQKGMLFQFEIIGDTLPKEIITFLNENAPKDLFRFEIGIQSTNQETTKLVGRIQNKKRLFENILALQKGGVIDLHLDLIAGLPNEDLSSFANTFNEVIALYPQTLQLGFLKFLRGTALYQEATRYHYQFMENAPYEIIESDFLSANDIRLIHTVEEVLEKYYNSHFMDETISYLLKNEKNIFEQFLQFGLFYETNFSWKKYHLHELFMRLYDYLKAIDYQNLDEAYFLMKYDYLNYHQIKPYIWWDKQQKKEKNELLKMAQLHYLPQYSLYDLYKYAYIEKHNNDILIAIYQPNRRLVKIINEVITNENTN